MAKGEDESVSRLRNIQSRIHELEPAMKKHEPGIAQRVAMLANAAGEIETGRGHSEEAGTYFRYASDALENLEGSDYDRADKLRKDYSRKATGMFNRAELEDKERKKRYAATHSKADAYRGAAVTGVVGTMFIGALMIGLPSMTGRVVSDVAEKTANVFGMCLIGLCLVVGYIFVSGRKN